MFFVLDALDHAGRLDEYGVAQMKRWQIVEATQSYHEMWSDGDLSQAWGRAPMIQLSASILAVRPLTPGFAKFEVRPQTCGLDWTRGIVPTPNGDIAVSWTKTSGALRLDITVPTGCEADVITDKKNHVGSGRHRFVSRPVDSAATRR